MTHMKTIYKQDLTSEYVYILKHIQNQIKLIENDVPIRRDNEWSRAREGVYRELEWLMQGLTVENREWVE